MGWVGGRFVWVKRRGRLYGVGVLEDNGCFFVSEGGGGRGVGKRD